MTNTITRQQANELIGKLNEGHVIDHPILIGDVLERLTNEKGLFDMCSAEELLDYWRPFGFKTPLRDILEGAKFEVVPCKEVHSNDRDCTNTEPALKDEKVEALFQFLVSLQLTK